MCNLTVTIQETPFQHFLLWTLRSNTSLSLLLYEKTKLCWYQHAVCTCPGSELFAPCMPSSHCAAWLACAGSSRYAKPNAPHNVEAKLLGAKLPCYADNPLFSRCHATGCSQTIQVAIACVDCFLGMLTSPLLLAGLHMDISAEDIGELLLWQEWTDGSLAPSPGPNARHCQQQPCFLQSLSYIVKFLITQLTFCNTSASTEHMLFSLALM